MFRLKVCGVTRVEDAQLCCEAGVDAIGLNFCEGSPRRVDPAVAQQIVQASQGKLELVGVFANLPGAEIRALALDLGLDFVQLHGGESPEVLAELSGLKVIKAIRVRPGGLAEFCKTAHAWLAYDAPPISALLVDAWVPGQLGGTGRPLESVLAREARDEIRALPFVLAGGLTPENVGEALLKIEPDAVDVASGVEVSPGIKDPARILAFVQQVRAVSRSK